MMTAPVISSAARSVQAQDPDRFLAALAVPAQDREKLYALYAFNAEISRIPDSVREEMMGHIRFAWWREALDELYAGSPGRQHETIQALRPLIAGGQLSREPIDRLMAARQEQFAQPGFATLEAFLHYGEETSSTLLYLALEVLGQAMPANLAQARELGIAYATIGQLRALTHNLRHRRCALPEALIEEFAVDRDLLAKAMPSPGLQQLAKYMLDKTAVRFTSKNPHLQSYAIITRHLRARLKHCGYNPFDPRLEHGRGWLALKLLCRW